MFSFEKFYSLIDENKPDVIWGFDKTNTISSLLLRTIWYSCVRLVMMAKAAVFHTANHLKELLINTRAHKHNSFHLPVNLYNHIQTTCVYEFFFWLWRETDVCGDLSK